MRWPIPLFGGFLITNPVTHLNIQFSPEYLNLWAEPKQPRLVRAAGSMCPVPRVRAGDLQLVLLLCLPCPALLQCLGNVENEYCFGIKRRIARAWIRIELIKTLSKMKRDMRQRSTSRPRLR